MPDYGKLLVKRAMTASALAEKAKVSRSTVNLHLSTFAKNQVIRINTNNLIFAHPKYFDKDKGNTWSALIMASQALVAFYPKEIPDRHLDALCQRFLWFIERYKPELLAEYEPPVGKSVPEEMPGPFTYVFQDWDDHFVYGFMNNETILLLDNNLKPHPDSRFYPILRKRKEFVDQIIARTKEAK